MSDDFDDFESDFDSFDQNYFDRRDATRDHWQYRDTDGTYGSHPVHDDYSDESFPD